MRRLVRVTLCLVALLAPTRASAEPGEIERIRADILKYLTDLPKQPGNKVLSGQHAGDSQPVRNPFSAQSGYAKYVEALKTSSKKLVAIVGGGYDACPLPRHRWATCSRSMR